MLQEQLLQHAVADIPCRDQEQLVRHAVNDQRIDEITVLCDDNACFAYRELVDHGVRGTIPLREIQRVHSVVTAISERMDQSPWQLRVDEKLHAEKGCTRLVWLSRVAYVRTARMSSYSRSS